MGYWTEPQTTAAFISVGREETVEEHLCFSSAGMFGEPLAP